MMLVSWILVQPRVHHMWRRLRRSRSVREDSGGRLHHNYIAEPQRDVSEGLNSRARFGQEDGGWTSLGSNGWRLDDLMVA